MTNSRLLSGLALCLAIAGLRGPSRRRRARWQGGQRGQGTVRARPAPVRERRQQLARWPNSSTSRRWPRVAFCSTESPWCTSRWTSRWTRSIAWTRSFRHRVAQARVPCPSQGGQGGAATPDRRARHQSECSGSDRDRRRARGRCSAFGPAARGCGRAPRCRRGARVTFPCASQ
jgi:hypothetical protein